VQLIASIHDARTRARLPPDHRIGIGLADFDDREACRRGAEQAEARDRGSSDGGIAILERREQGRRSSRVSHARERLNGEQTRGRSRIAQCIRHHVHRLAMQP